MQAAPTSKQLHCFVWVLWRGMQLHVLDPNFALSTCKSVVTVSQGLTAACLYSSAGSWSFGAQSSVEQALSCPCCRL